jgi:hypothetical protein
MADSMSSQTDIEGRSQVGLAIAAVHTPTPTASIRTGIGSTKGASQKNRTA